jgi:hypothetical protein
MKTNWHNGHNVHSRFGLTDADLDAIYPQVRRPMSTVDREHLEETIGWRVSHDLVGIVK